ncbi:hypothetical protein MGU_11247 [Metarhizium guizhouense ARSEF 977]|uniref:Uncharacterized protein n=1 Tax=Metarhizium guizhouense (strain ARSEF 977) TaxID=1276136 RepID=A0A0B4GNU3_METGA|nr:hypothetical protein MGU_11247 [Metarhizium guizhouense ARSEF 977]
MDSEIQDGGQFEIAISETDVAGALDLAGHGQQRLSPVPAHDTRYYFSVHFSTHRAAAEIAVAVLSLKDSSNVLFRPKLRYTICCDAAPEDEFKRRFQAVYDVLIRPIQWKFDKESQRVVRPPYHPQTTEASCHEIALFGLQHLRQSGRRVKKRKRTYRPTSQRVATDIVQTLRQGGPQFPVLPFPICNTTVTQEETLEQRVRFTEDLWNLGTGQQAYKVISWANRFYSSCMRRLLRRKKHIPGDRVKDRAAQASCSINSIVNALSMENESEVCLCSSLVYSGFGKLGYNLTALKTSNDRDKFSRGVVEELRGKLPTASVSDLVFHAPAVVAFLWKESYGVICEDLGAPKLARYDLSNRVIKVGTEGLYTYAVYFGDVCPLHRGPSFALESTEVAVSLNETYYNLETLPISALGIDFNSLDMF